MDPKIKDIIYEAGPESPGSWFLQGLNLRVAADRLDWIKNPVREEDKSISLLAEYRLLMALSFENLLKGLIMLQRLEKNQSPSFPKKCYTHNLEKLAKMIDFADIKIEQHEIELLSCLTPYIEWAGRYPLPKRKEEIVAIYHGTRQRDNELMLWNKLANILKERAWIMKGGPESKGGSRLYLKKKTQSEP